MIPALTLSDRQIMVTTGRPVAARARDEDEEVERKGFLVAETLPWDSTLVDMCPPVRVNSYPVNLRRSAVELVYFL